MDTEKIFNYQLTIQKLEEELALYRNGTSGQQLLELIAEKDSEIKSLKEILSEKNDKLRLLARSSNEFIVKHQELQIERNNLLKQVEEYLLNISQQDEQIRHNNDMISSQTEKIRYLQNKVCIIEEELTERTICLEKVQLRCATIVKEKQQQTKQYENEKNEKSKQMTKYRDEIEKSMKLNGDIRQKLTNENRNAIELTLKVSEMQLQITEANNRNALLTEEVKTNENIKNDLTNLKSQLEGTTQQLKLIEKNSKITLYEKNVQLETLEKKLLFSQKQYSKLEDSSKKEIQKVEKAHHDELKAVEMKNKDNVEVAKVYETEKEQFQNHKRENQKMKVKIQELEDKVHRQEQYMRSKLVKDKCGAIAGNGDISFSSSSYVDTTALLDQENKHCNIVSSSSVNGKSSNKGIKKIRMNALTTSKSVRSAV